MADYLIPILLVLVLCGPLVWSIFRLFGRTATRPAAGNFTEVGQHRVVLQVAGPNLIAVIREIMRTTGRGLREAKNVAEAAPIVVVEGLSEQSAELVADRLRAAGARALAAPIGEM